MPSLSSVRTLSTCCLLVSGFFTEIAQHIHSLRARGVSSSHAASASASEARVFRKSSGNSWTTPPEISLLVIVISLYYYKIALSRKDCRSECASSICLSSPVPNLQKWCANIRLWSGLICYQWLLKRLLEPAARRCSRLLHCAARKAEQYESVVQAIYARRLYNMRYVPR